MEAAVRAEGSAAEGSATDWMAQFDAVCAEHGQSAVARQIGVSPATVSQVRKGTYGASTDNIRDAFLAHYGGLTVVCPVLGEISGRACYTNRNRDLTTTNPLRVQLWRACQVCPNNPSAAS